MLSIGLTFDLRSNMVLDPSLPMDFFGEYDSEETIDAVALAIEEAGFQVVRIGNGQQLMRFLSAGNRVDMVFNMAEGWGGRGREAQVPAMLDMYGIPYTFADTVAMALCLDKAMTKQIWHAAGLPTAPFIRLTNVDDLPAVKELAFPLFVKPIHEGSSKGIDLGALIETQEALRTRVAYVLDYYRQPALVEEFLPGREFTVGILDDALLGMVEITAVSKVPVNGYEQKEKSSGQWKRTAEDAFSPLHDPALEKKLGALALRAYHSVEARDAARVDIRLDRNGQPQLLEINPLAGLHPTHSALPLIARQAGLPFPSFIAAILDSAFRRVEQSTPVHTCLNMENTYDQQ